jgi:hypothetical protein
MRGFGYQGSASRAAGSAPCASSESAAHSRTGSGARRMAVGATAFGEILPRHGNQVTLDPAKKDKWGLPVLAIDCETGENERLMREDMKNDMAELLEAAGVRSVTTYDQRLRDGHGHSRDGHGPHGQRRANVGAQSLETRLGRAERVRDRTARAWCPRRA